MDASIGQQSSNLVNSIQRIEQSEDRFPARLFQLEDPPRALFVRGRLPDAPLIAIVGSRGADAATRRFVRSLAADLVESGVAIISGGARGIDTAAHQGALSAGGMTVAVLGSGFNFTYPEENLELFEQIAGQGALITEFEPFQPPTRWTFPKRNRIIAALAEAVVVAHASLNSGALITAKVARELGVPLGAVPGAAGDLGHRGSNQLLRTGARMIEEAQDVLALVDNNVGGPRILDLPGIAPRGKEKPDPPNLTTQELKILDILGARPIHIDDIIAGTGLEIGETSAAIMSLEIAGLVEDQGGRHFVRVC